MIHPRWHEVAAHAEDADMQLVAGKKVFKKKKKIFLMLILLSKAWLKGADNGHRSHAAW